MEVSYMSWEPILYMERWENTFSIDTTFCRDLLFASHPNPANKKHFKGIYF